METVLTLLLWFGIGAAFGLGVVSAVTVFFMFVTSPSSKTAETNERSIALMADRNTIDRQKVEALIEIYRQLSRMAKL